MESTNQWNAALYDEKLSFVSNYGKSIVPLLDPQKGEYILDLGCGTGDLTNEIKSYGAEVVGMDASKEMLEKADEKYPAISFVHADAKTFQMTQKCDAIFSNAALHWIKEPEKVAHSVYNALLPGGRFVAEFGGKGNVTTIINGMLAVLKEEYHITAETRIPWYFPSVGEYSRLLEQIGFRVVYAQHFDRPTILGDGVNGLHHWLESFADDFFYDFTAEERITVYEKVKDRIRPQLFSEGNWVADYKRLRIIAMKES